MNVFGGLSIWRPRRDGSLQAAFLAALAVTALTAICDLPNIFSSRNVATSNGADIMNTAFSVVALFKIAMDVPYRLVVMSLLVALYRWVWGARHQETMDWGALAAAAIAQGLLLYLMFPKAVLDHPVQELFRSFVPGVVWGWLYWRYNFITAIAADWASSMLIGLLLHMPPGL